MDTKYDVARREVLSAGDDWDKMLAAAYVLSMSPDYSDQKLAEIVDQKYQAHLYRTEAEAVARYYAAKADETPAQIMGRIIRSDWPAIALGGLAVAFFVWAALAAIMGVK